MSTLDEPKTMTVDEFLALPDDGVERWLINGELREAGNGITVRSFRHSELTMKIGFFLLGWLKAQPDLQGHIVGGEAGFRLPNSEKTLVGVDAAYVTAETAQSRTRSGVIVGAPLVAIEILSPSDRFDIVEEKVDAYLSAGTNSVWIVNPMRSTVTVYQPGVQPKFYDQTQTITDSALPKFALRLAELFA